TLGPFIVKKEYRNQGYGTQIWQSAMALIQDNPTIILHAVPLQIPRYQKQGFESQYINQGWTLRNTLSREKEPFTEAQSITPEWLPAVIHYDKTIFGASRKKLLTEVLKLSCVHSVLLDNEGQVTGFGLIRPCRDGYRVGPLFADTPEQAKQIFSYLIKMVDEDKIIVDIPQKNPFSNLFVEYFGLKAISEGETNAMLKGENIEQNFDKNYGVFSLEIG
ncbi:MAG: GNAT family N-acetyltransferase, partial [Silvanigrellaceae bacterium]|nr:GNAT family N-acetyltransferase [Silvanigrellaceae bacterium]